MTITQSIIAGQDFYRIREEFSARALVFPIEASISAISVGPESDFDEYVVTYWDSAIQQQVSVAVSKDRPFVGRIDSFPSEQLAGGAFRIITVTPRNLFNATDIVGDKVTIDAPTMDVFFYMKEPSTIPTKRASRRSSAPAIVQTGKVSTYAFPVYGRRSWSMLLHRAGNTAAFSATVVAVKFIMANGATGVTSHSVLLPETPLPIDGGIGGLPLESVEYSHDSVKSGYYDFCYIIVTALSAAGNDPAAFIQGGLQIVLDVRD